MIPRQLPRAPPTFRTMFNNPTIIPRTVLSSKPFAVHRPFHSSTANMTIPVWFEVEYTDADLDKHIGAAKKKGGDAPKRK